MRSLDVRLFRDVNHWAARTPALHGTGVAAATWAPFVVAILAVGAAWLRGRRRPDAPQAVAGCLWAVLAALVAAAVDRPLAGVLGRARPYQALAGVEVLVGRTHSPGFPSLPAAVAAAVAVALWSVDRAWAAAASAAALVLAAARVYAGAAYPTDALAGLGLGTVLALALRPPAMLVLGWLTAKIERSPLHLVVAAHRA